ncbi:hypothetical protein V8B97DRAFT_2009335 [Scleroderma yunnanense]
MSTNHSDSSPAKFNGQQAGRSNGAGEDMGLLTEYLSIDNQKSTHLTGQATSLKEEVEHLRFLFSESADHDESLVNESDLENLLAQLDDADEVANGVESRLDDILDTLDGLLDRLEEQDPQRTNQDPPTDSTVAGS